MKTSKTRRLLALLLILVLTLTPALAAYEDAAPAEAPADASESGWESLTADMMRYYPYCSSVCLMDRNTKQVLYEYNGYGAIYPASTTKVMTALLCAKYGNMDDWVYIYDSDYENLIGEDPSLAGFWPGSYVSVRSLMVGLLLPSGCDAADVIARYIGGTIPHFVEMMNEEARALGCMGTHFVSPHGLPDYNHYTTAYDMALIGSAAMDYPAIRDIVCQSAIYVPELGSTLYNTNGLLPGSGSYYSYQYCIGVKTGSHSAAGMCLVSCAAKDGVELVCAIYGAPSADSRYAQCAELLEWGFSVDQHRSIEQAQVRVSQDSFLYDGTEIRPAVTVTYGGYPLTQGTDYQLSYQNNIQAGQAQVIVTGMGSYYGSLTRSFTIRSPLPFTDVPTGYWAFPVIRTAYNQGLIQGREPTLFAPEDPVNRAEAVTLLHRFLGSPPAAGIVSFTDLEGVDYALEAIRWAVGAGVIQGRSETEFDPFAPVTREELAAMLSRTGGYAPTAAGLDPKFVDRDQVSPWAADPMAWAAETGLIGGREEETGLWLAPQSSATRAEVTALLTRFRDWRSQQSMSLSAA